MDWCATTLASIIPPAKDGELSVVTVKPENCALVYIDWPNVTLGVIN